MMKGEPSITTLRDWSEKRGWGALRRKNLSSISTPLPRKFYAFGISEGCAQVVIKEIFCIKGYRIDLFRN